METLRIILLLFALAGIMASYFAVFRSMDHEVTHNVKRAGIVMGISIVFLLVIICTLWR